MLHGTLADMAQATPTHGPGLQLRACDNVFIWFLDQENIGLDPQIMILREVISEILEISFCDSWKFPNEVVPLMEDHGWGGGWGGGGGAPSAHGLFRITKDTPYLALPCYGVSFVRILEKQLTAL